MKLIETGYKDVVKLLSVVACPDKNFIFFRVPKVAGTSIYRGVLEENYNTLCHRPNKRSFPIWADSLNYIEFRDRYFKFTFVRNPYDRFLSLFFYFTTYKPVRKGYDLRKRWKEPVPDFETFVKDFYRICYYRGDIRVHGIPQYFYSYYNGKRFVDFIGKFETLQNSFDWVMTTLGLEQHKLPKLQPTVHDWYPHYYNPELADLVYSYYEMDFKLFGYKKDIV